MAFTVTKQAAQMRGKITRGNVNGAGLSLSRNRKSRHSARNLVRNLIMDNVYGVVDNGIHIDVSNTERGAKCYATRHGFSIVSVRVNCGYFVAIIAERVNGKWQAIKE